MGLYTKQDEILNTIRVLRGELEVLSSRLKPHGTGYIYTALDVIQSRIDELVEEVTAPYWKDEDGDIGRLPGQTRSSHLRSIEGAYDEDIYDNLEGQARLRKIQDSAAGHDTVEHTKEYYDGVERNRAPSIQTMTSDGLSNRTMKQRYGQAVQTVSEMMQDELEPLPINTFE